MPKSHISIADQAVIDETVNSRKRGRPPKQQDVVTVVDLMLSAQDIAHQLGQKEPRMRLQSSRLSFYLGFFLGMVFVAQAGLLYFSWKVAAKEQAIVQEALLPVYAASVKSSE